MIAWAFACATAAADPRATAVSEALMFDGTSGPYGDVTADLKRKGPDFDRVLWRWALGEDPILARAALPHLATTDDLEDRVGDVTTAFAKAAGDPGSAALLARAFDRVADRSPRLRLALVAVTRASLNDAMKAALLGTRAVAAEVGADANLLRRWLARDDAPRTRAAAAELIALDRQPAAWPTLLVVLRDRGPGLPAVLSALADREFRPYEVRLRLAAALIPRVRAIAVDRDEPMSTRRLARAALFKLRGGRLRAAVVGRFDRPRAACARRLARH